MKKHLDSFLRKDLNLQNKWWHRLLKSLFFIFIMIVTLSLYADFDIAGYKKIGNLYDYIGETPKTVEQILKEQKIEGVIISNQTEPTNKKDYPWSVPKDAICSSDLTNTVDSFVSNGYELYVGKMFGRVQMGKNEFLSYIKNNNIKCIVPTFYTGNNGKDILMIQTYEEDIHEKNYLYKPSELKTVYFFLFGTYFFDTVYMYEGLLFILGTISAVLFILYYKVILYIIFGSKKD